MTTPTHARPMTTFAWTQDGDHITRLGDGIWIVSNGTEFQHNDGNWNPSLLAGEASSIGVPYRMWKPAMDANPHGVISGVGPDAPTVTNSKGAKQSSLPYRLDLVPPKALLDVAKVLHHGAEKYGDVNWRGISVDEHLNHALTHIYAYLSGDTQDNHLGHAACRLLMAHEQRLSSNSQ